MAVDGAGADGGAPAPGDQISLAVTPDPYVTVLPGRILHGLWSMAQVARALGPATGDDPGALKSLSVQFRGMGAIGEEIVVSGTVEDVVDGVATVKLDALQGTTKIIKGAVAELRIP
jgi:acyl dehydratase